MGGHVSMYASEIPFENSHSKLLFPQITSIYPHLHFVAMKSLKVCRITLKS